jgi:hypothetical protein
MRHSLLVCLLLVAAALPAAQSSKRAPSSASVPWTPPRTSDGQPDLQGVWLNNSATPLERPKELEGRSTLTDDEVVELKRRADRLFKDGRTDFAAGDAVFLAALANADQYRNPNATGTNHEMIDREFDNRTSLIVSPADGRIPALTARGKERVSRTPPPTAAGQRNISGPEDYSNALRCISYGVPRLGGNNLSGAGPLGYYQIVQGRGYVAVMLEAIHELRIIPLDARPHLPQGVRLVSGDSRGRWEGNTLVVDTTNFSSRSNFMGSSETLHLIERFSRVGDDRLVYQITVDDLTTWTAPWTAEIRLQRRLPRGQLLHDDGHAWRGARRRRDPPPVIRGLRLQLDFRAVRLHALAKLRDHRRSLAVQRAEEERRTLPPTRRRSLAACVRATFSSYDRAAAGASRAG